MARLNKDLQIDILRLFLEPGEDFSVRGMARRLNISSSLAHYHLRKMVDDGILIPFDEGPRTGYYEPQDIFTEDVEATLEVLKVLRDKIEDYSDEKLGNCIRILLACSNKM